MFRAVRILCRPPVRVPGYPPLVVATVDTGEDRLAQNLQPVRLYQSWNMPRRALVWEVAARLAPPVAFAAGLAFGPYISVVACVLTYGGCQFTPRLTRAQWGAIKKSIPVYPWDD